MVIIGWKLVPTSPKLQDAHSGVYMSYTLLIANDFPPVTSGIATVFGEIWRRLPPERTRILAPVLPDTADIDRDYPIDIQRIYLPLGESSGAKLTKTGLTTAHILLKGLLNRPALIHCGQVFSSGLAGLWAKRLYNIPYVVWVYGSETARLATGGKTATLMKRILDESKWVITNSNMTSDEFREFGVPDAKIKCVYPGVDPEKFSPAPKDPEQIKELNLQDKKVILTVARLDQRKGHDMVLQALANLPEDVVYLIGGRGREEERLRQIAADLGVDHRTHFLGFVPDDDLPTLYNLCDVFVMPNRITQGTALEGDIEGFGITFIEAGSCEKPVIAGRSGGAVEAVLDGETGLLVDPESVSEITETIVKCLEDPALSQKLGSQARQRIQRELDWNILARLVEEIL